MSRLVAEALRLLRAQPVLSLVAVLAVAHALFFVGAAAWVGSQVGAARAAMADGLVVTASLDPALDEPAIEAALARLAEPAEVEVVRVRTPREERERLGELLGTGLLEGLDDLALPLGVTVDLTLSPASLDEAALERLEATVRGLAGVTGVVSLPWSPTHIRTLFAFGSLVGWLAWALGALALVVATTIVAQATRRRLAETRAQRELELAFGATARWLDLPAYAIAGVVGALGAAGALLLATLVQGRLVAVTSLLPGLAAPAPIAGAPYLVWCVAGGLGIGLFGAWLALTSAARRG
ncbi:MAG: hypothetical protein IT385_01525 [Deltaproteobacteria bacterium]|nr:hypothetical protein [Deltaproteobacteria bacterium]